MSYFLSRFQWLLYDILKIKIMGVKVAYLLISVIGTLTIISNYLLWRIRKKETRLFLEFYIALHIGIFIFHPLYALFKLLFKGYVEALRTAVVYSPTVGLTSGIAFSFIYLFFFHRKRLFDIYDHTLPFLLFFYGTCYLIIAFGYGGSFGRPTSLPWGVFYHPGTRAGTLYHQIPLHPVPLYIALFLLSTFSILLYRLERRNFEGEIALWSVFCVGVARMAEFFLSKYKVDPHPAFFSAVSLISLICLIFLYYRSFKKKSFFQ